MPIHSCFIQEHLRIQRRKPVSELRNRRSQRINEKNRHGQSCCSCPYIINLGNTIKPETRELAVSFLRQEIERCDEISATRLVLHPGAHVKAEMKQD